MVLLCYVKHSLQFALVSADTFMLVHPCLSMSTFYAGLYSDNSVKVQAYSTTQHGLTQTHAEQQSNYDISVVAANNENWLTYIFLWRA